MWYKWFLVFSCSRCWRTGCYSGPVCHWTVVSGGLGWGYIESILSELEWSFILYWADVLFGGMEVRQYQPQYERWSQTANTCVLDRAKSPTLGLFRLINPIWRIGNPLLLIYGSGAIQPQLIIIFWTIYKRCDWVKKYSNDPKVNNNLPTPDINDLKMHYPSSGWVLSTPVKWDHLWLKKRNRGLKNKRTRLITEIRKWTANIITCEEYWRFRVIMELRFH